MAAPATPCRAINPETRKNETYKMTRFFNFKLAFMGWFPSFIPIKKTGKFNFNFIEKFLILIFEFFYNTIFVCYQFYDTNYALQFLDHFSRILLLNKRIFLVWKYFSPTAIFFPTLFALMEKLFIIFGLKKE